MAIRSLKTGQFSRSALVGNPVIMPGSYESIATVTVGSGGASSIDFTNIPSTYSHLQIRAITKGSTTSRIWMRFNNVSTGTPYDYHSLYGNGTSAGAIADTSENEIWLAVDGQSATTDTFTGLIVDILDYSNTNKNKTTRSLGGHSIDSASYWIVWFESGLWRSTNAINRITLTASSGTFSQYSTFALYGVN
jgi:hypothetical protein